MRGNGNRGDGKNGNGNAVLEWERVGMGMVMGMGMIRWEWEGMGTRKSFPHTSTLHVVIRVLTAMTDPDFPVSTWCESNTYC